MDTSSETVCVVFSPEHFAPCCVYTGGAWPLPQEIYGPMFLGSVACTPVVHKCFNACTGEDELNKNQCHAA